MKKMTKMLAAMFSVALALSMVLNVSIVKAANGKIETQDELVEALAKGGEVDLTDQTINLTSPLTISASNVTITGGTLVGTEGVTQNLVTITGSVTMNGTKIQTVSPNKSALHIYGGTLTATDLTVDHSNAASGAPVLVNENSTATFNGLSLTLGTASWYGVNVDKNSTATFAGVTANTSGTQSVVCVDGEGSTVTGLDLAIVRTENDGDGTQTQTAYVNDANLSEFVKAKKGKVTEIELQRDVQLSSPLFLEEALTVNGNNHSLIGTASIGKENVVTITAEGVVLNNLGIKTDAANKSGLHVYQVPATVNNLTIDNTQTAGGAGIVVNSGALTVTGALNITLGDNSWGGINIDDKYGPASIDFTNATAMNVSAVDSLKQLPVYADEGRSEQVTVNGAEKVGLTDAGDGKYYVAVNLTLIGVVDGEEVEGANEVVAIPTGVVLDKEMLEELESSVDDTDMEGYTFKGFFLDKEGKSKLTEGYTFNEDTSIYMIWEKTVKEEKPDDTVKPGNTTKPGTSNTNKPSQTGTVKSSTPKTGDNSNIVLYGVLVLVSCAVACGAVKRRKSAR